MIIDVLSPLFTTLNDENSEAFLISLDFMEKADEMTTNLANRSFSYFLFTISNVSASSIKSANTNYDIINTNSFVYTATDRYLFDEFYEIMIDTRASKH